jgi:hypothetical protein
MLYVLKVPEFQTVEDDHSIRKNVNIIREGEKPQRRQTQWWEGKVVTCPLCGFKASLTPGDDEQVQTELERRPNGKRRVWVTCQTSGCFGSAAYEDHGEPPPPPPRPPLTCPDCHGTKTRSVFTGVDQWDDVCEGCGKIVVKG